MSIDAPAENWSELGDALGALAASGGGEVREDGEWLADLAALHCEVHCKAKDPVLHLWSEDLSLTRRILRVKQREPGCIILEVHRFGRARPGKLEFLSNDSRRTPGQISRAQFRARFSRILAERFPDATVEALSSSPDLEHSLSGLYVRGRMREGSSDWALLGVSAAEDTAAVDGMLASGLLWLDWTRAHSARRAVEGLRLFVPEGKSRNLRERSLALSSSARTEIFEYTDPDARMLKMDTADAGNLESWLVPRREVDSLLVSAQDALNNIRAILPGSAGTIETRIFPRTKEVALCFRGLEFARYTKEGIFFGLGEKKQRLSEERQLSLDRLVGQLDLSRNSLATDTKHRLYRAAPERWLETLLLEDPTRLDACLDPRFLYSQLPAIAAGDRGVLDLLGVTRQGRLVVIELKASEDMQMPVQAADYWLRVRRHQQEGDFQSYGYFNGIQLSAQPPLLWLVAPGLRFHPSTSVLLQYFSREIQVTRIGLNENWRRGVKVVFRQ